jgi:hypothetical protein
MSMKQAWLRRWWVADPQSVRHAVPSVKRNNRSIHVPEGGFWGDQLRPEAQEILALRGWLAQDAPKWAWQSWGLIRKTADVFF